MDTRIKCLWKIEKYCFQLCGYLPPQVHLLYLLDIALIVRNPSAPEYHNTYSLKMSESFLLTGAILMEIPIVMVLLSRILNYRTNRWVNKIAGLIKTFAMIMTMFVGTPTYYYIFFGTIEIATTILIVWYDGNGLIRKGAQKSYRHCTTACRVR